MPSEEETEKTRPSCVLLTTTLLLILVLVISALVLMAIVAVKMSRRTHQHAIVFDAGSTHTQMLIFTWLSDKSDGAFETAWVKQSYSHSIPVGISTLAEVGESMVERRVKHHLTPLIDRADYVIPENERYRTNVLLGATAGMRLLQIKDERMCHLILMAVQKYVKERGYRIANHDDIRIISGKEEALYGWISANILMSKINPWSKKCTPVGITDLGGASMQVAFEYHNNPEMVDESVKTSQITLYGTTFQVYGRSFLCWGKEQSHYRYLNYLLKFSHVGENVYSDPCGVVGHSYTRTLHKILSHTCINEQPRPESPRQVLFFKGTGDTAACESIVKQMFRDEIAAVQNEEGDFTPIDTVSTMIRDERNKQRFVAFSGFYHVWRAMGEPQGRNNFQRALRHTCTRNADYWNKHSGNDTRFLN